jgi:hypothetical protein
MNRRTALVFGATIGATVVGAGFSGKATAQVGRRTGNISGIPSDVVALLDPTLDADLLILSDLGPDTYYVISQFGDQGTGEPVFIRKPGNGEPVIISDTRALPLELTLGIGGFNAAAGASTIDFDVAGYTLDPHDLSAYVSGGQRAPSADIDVKVGSTAKEKLGMGSKDAPGTNHGRLACAWAVNRVVTTALGRPIGGGLSTANMVQVLKARHAKVSEQSAPPGAVIISPTEQSGGHANIGHVGLLGADGKIFSNSSNDGQWEQNFSVSSWKSYYGGKGLTVQFYRLDGDYF